MKFKIGDKVKVVSLTNTKAAFNLDSQGIMKTALNNIYTINYIINSKHHGERIYLNFNSGGYMWHKNDLQLIGSKELEIE